MPRSRLTIALLVSLAAATVAAEPQFRSVWKAAEISQLKFAGKKIAAVVITGDQSLQISGEEALARELNARKVQSIPAYRFVPREEMASADTARGWFERAGVQGVVALRPVSYENNRPSSPVSWTPYSESFWSYYHAGWTTGVTLTRQDTSSVVVETLVFNLSPERLVWAATSETKNPKDLPSFIAELVSAVVREMQKMKLLSGK
jgi:hypothetical protein